MAWALPKHFSWEAREAMPQLSSPPLNFQVFGLRGNLFSVQAADAHHASLVLSSPYAQSAVPKWAE
jgi:hypothetical protein